MRNRTLGSSELDKARAELMACYAVGAPLDCDRIAKAIATLQKLLDVMSESVKLKRRDVVLRRGRPKKLSGLSGVFIMDDPDAQAPSHCQRSVLGIGVPNLGNRAECNGFPGDLGSVLRKRGSTTVLSE